MIAIIDYGAGNLFSVKNALDFLGLENKITNSAADLSAADRLILPGVGAFPDAMRMLGETGLIGVIKEEVRKKPLLGICLGMQMAIVEYARDVLGYTDANSIELDPETTHPVIALMPDQEDVEDLGGTLRLGAYPCILKEGTRSRELFGKEEISERHRHRYEVNNKYRAEFEAKGMTVAGCSPDKRIVEMIEVVDHPYFVGTQGHPEFKSRPNHAHPLFRGLVTAAAAYAKEK